MGLFDVFQKKKEKQTVTSERKYLLETDYPIDKSNWFQVYSACLGPTMIIQNACAELVVKNQNWNVDFSKRVIAFGNDEYPVQFLGSEANSDDSWMWGWNNVNGFDESIISFAYEVKEIGEAWGLEPLTVPVFELSDTFNGHSLATVACGVTKHKYCYYRGPHSNGAALMGFSKVTDEVFTPVNLSKFCPTVLNCLQNFHIDHRIFIESLLMWNGTLYEWNDNKIIAHFEQDLEITFEQVDEFLRVSGMKSITL